MMHGWETNKLGNVCKVIAGQSPEGRYYNDKGKGLPFYQGKKEFSDKFIGQPTTWTTDITKEALDGDILMSVRAPVGPINFSTQRICIGRGLAAIRASKLIDREFLFLFLVKHENEIVGNTGAVFNSISKSQIESISIPLPPLPEQHRIVAILDEVFDSITRAKELAERNLRNARELYDSYLQNIFDNSIKKWEVKKLGAVCEISMGQSPDGSTYNSNGIGMPLINGPVEFGPEPFSETIKSKFTTQPTKTCRKGDLILCVRGSTTGRINIAGFNACIGRGVASIRYERCQPWINYFVLANRLKIYKMGTGSTFPNVSGQLISSLLVPIPALNEQQRLIKDLDKISMEVKKMESIYQQKLSDLEELKKSVLQKAFNGELITD